MIASSHWTSTKSAFRQLAAVNPAAVTLKTTSIQKGGSGSGAGRDLVWLADSFGNHFARYTDGPPTLEFWDLETTGRMTQEARATLPTAALGLSVLQGEDYETVRASVPLGLYAYVEFNCKYSLRGITVSQAVAGLGAFRGELCRFLEVFDMLPVLVKLPPESGPLLGSAEFDPILESMGERAGLLLANSKRLRVPPSRLDARDPTERTQGVVVGDHLFLDVYNMIRSLRQQGARPQPRLVASGGLSDVGSVVDALAAGASAVQLCTALDARSPQVVTWLRNQLRSLSAPFGGIQKMLSAFQADEDAWFGVAARARQFPIDHNRAVDVLVNDKTTLALVEDALIEECKNLPPSVASGASKTPPSGLRFVTTYGNVSSYLLASRCIQAFDFAPIELEAASSFIRSLNDSGFEYEFAIVPVSAVQASSGIAGLGDRAPKVVGTVGRSIVELAGTATDPQKVEHVYHFAGNSAKRAVGEFSRGGGHTTSELAAAKLLPVLQTWEDSAGVLAKPPLSQMYGSLRTKEDVASKSWRQIWSTHEPLVLVASQAFLASADGDVIAKTVLSYIEEQRAEVLSKPRKSALELRATGFLAYCATLLKRKG